MTKRIISVLFAVCLALSMSVVAFANGLPLDKIDAPEALAFRLSYPNEGSECMEGVFFVPDNLAGVLSLSADDQIKYYGSAFQGCVQYDWSVDSKTDFHYDETWDTIETDAPMQKLTGSFLEQTEVFWLTYDTDAERLAPGVVTKTKTVEATTAAGNLPFAPADEESTEPANETISYRVFDFKGHKLYVRARFFVYEFASEKCYFSDWSDVEQVKASTQKPQIKNDVERPKLSKARVEEDGRYLFDISFDRTLKKAAYDLRLAYGTDLNLEAQIRINGGEWEYRILPNGLYPYLVGTRSFIAENDGGKLEFRCRLVGGNIDDGTEIDTGWSDIFTEENGNITIEINNDPFDEEAKRAEAEAAEKEANKCKVCGICPIHPLGICMFIWIGIIVIIALIVVYNIIAHKKKVARAEELRKREEASRSAQPDKTASIFNTDRIIPNSGKDEESEEESEETEDNQEKEEDK